MGFKELTGHEHMKVWGEWSAGDGIEAPYLSPTPCPKHLLQCCWATVFYNKPVFLWDLWTTPTNWSRPRRRLLEPSTYKWPNKCSGDKLDTRLVSQGGAAALQNWEHDTISRHTVSESSQTVGHSADVRELLRGVRKKPTRCKWV